ncbi:deoxyribodipyrimidine photo-lyase [Marinobacter zhejiangensis]|uniref:Deoxyribodipyrimidine photo-lyase n=1 Tax=Marinobacter zhejiangensis TaxID=488535 RepID=A0A1I4N5F4_9GAMM|nr:deoxyribodipyrimidine photo-lyase [Marinobacter zhejiangensis]SFM10751.1 deoxyribodipyrimidine photo-lyase [Marinobacter zhejiangensis]
MTQLVWFRNDLRTTDNPALTAACSSGAPVKACYIVTPEQWQQHDWSPARVHFVLDNLQALGNRLAELGIPLVTLYAKRFDDSIATLKDFCCQNAVQTLHMNAEYGINERRRDRTLKTTLGPEGLKVCTYHDQCVAPVGSILTAQGTPYTVFTPFYRRWSQWLQEQGPAIYPEPSPVGPALAPPLPPNASLFHEDAPPPLVACGEPAAHQRLGQFLDEQAGHYDQDRDFPARTGTSLLSPYLANGVLSGGQCWAAALPHQGMTPEQQGVSTWIKELAWRDFYVHILYHFPRVSMNRAFKQETEALAWNSPDTHLDAWKEGQTGVPIVDAAMRQLNQTGWMHNRLRMVAAMYLTKNLFIDWRLGERYFMSKLVDGFLASNNGGWQWSASTGTDAAPYFRVFNPVSQSEKFDPQGEFIRRYVPELAALDNKRIHQPWQGGVIPGGYPRPLVDLKESRKEAIARFQALKEG